MTQAPKQRSQWISLDSVPLSLATQQYVLEPLSEQHAELDFEALMSCRVRLREELQWGKWPPEGFTLEFNRTDLRDHHDEFLRGEAFAFTVLATDRSRCLGCIYIERCEEFDGAQLAFWVIDDALEMEATLVADVLQWIYQDWPIKRVVIPLRHVNRRGIALATDLGLVAMNSDPGGLLANHLCFLVESGQLVNLRD